MPLDSHGKSDTIGHRPWTGGPDRDDTTSATQIIAYNHQLHAHRTLSVCKYAHETTKYADEEFDPERVLMHGKEIADGVRDVCGFVAVVDDAVVGLIFGYRLYNFININSMAIDRALYVLPEHRSVATFDALLTAFEQWAAEDAWCRQVIISVTEMDRCASVHRLLRTRGYTLKYRQFGKEL